MTTCAKQLYGGSLEQPPEWCEEYVDDEGDSDYCLMHQVAEPWDLLENEKMEQHRGVW